MSTQENLFSFLNIPQKKKRTIDVNGTLNKYLYHWPLYVLCLLITFSAVFFYLKILRPKTEYNIKATLLIKDEKKSPDEKSALQEIDLLNSSKVIENELEVLKSKQLIIQVVRDLQLWIIYKQKDGLTFDDLYKSSPIKFNLIKATGNYERGKIDILINDQSSFFMKTSDGRLKKYLFREKYQNSMGTWTLEPVMQLQLLKGTEIQILVYDPEQLASQYQSAIDISLTSKLATAIDLSFKDPVPQRGKDVLNQLIFNYNLTSTIKRNSEIKRTIDFLDQRIDSLAVELSTAEKGIEGFKSSRGLTDIASDSKISLENMQSNDNRLNEVNVQLSIVDGIERYVNSSQNNGKVPATLGITDAALSSLIEKLSQLQLQRDRLLATTPETNPDFDPINRQIATTRSAIKENVNSIKMSLLNTRDKLQTYNSRFESSIKTIPTQERQYISIKRQQTSKENLYTYLLQKREELSVNYASTLSDNYVIDKAYAEPMVGLKKSMYFVIAIILGLSLPTSLLYARNSLSSKIISLDHIKDILDLSIIGEIPFERFSKGLVINNHDINATTEQIRALRTKLHHKYDSKVHGRVTLITSSVPGEGKSFISSNLSASFAFADRKTVLVELDMRKPKIIEIFNLARTNFGISDFIQNSTTEIIQKSGIIPKLDIISSGTSVENPTELLEKNSLKDLILKLRNDYDDIIIDSPPIHLVPDALILARLSDITLYVIRQGYTKKAEMNFLKEISEQKILPEINLVFNGVERTKYGYGYNYLQPYYNVKKTSLLSLIFNDFWGRF